MSNEILTQIYSWLRYILSTEVLLQIEAFVLAEEHEIEIPFPQRDIHIRSVPALPGVLGNG